MTGQERHHRARVFHEMSEISPGYVLCSMWPHKPKRSATADRKEAPSANRANRRTISVPFSVSCAVFEFIRASGILLYFSILVSCSLFGRETHASTTQSD